MYLTLHAVVGAALGQAVGSPGASFVVGAVSHYGLDAIPHGDEVVAGWVKHAPKKGLAVGLVDLAVLAVIAASVLPLRPDRTLLFWGAAGSVLPDVISNIIPFVHQSVFRTHVLERARLRLGRTSVAALHRWHNNFHYGLHNPLKIRLSFVQGVIFQAIATLAVLVWLLG